APRRPRRRTSSPPPGSPRYATGSAGSAGWSAARQSLQRAAILAIRMKMVINLFRDSFADARHALDLGEAGAGDGARGAEMVQQRLFAFRADAGDLVERRAPERFRMPRTVGADGKAVRLVAQPLQEIEHRVARLERERRPSRHEESLAPGVAVRPLGDADDR